MAHYTRYLHLERKLIALIYSAMDKTSNVEDLEKLAELKTKGMLSESEFESEKQKILNR